LTHAACDAHVEQERGDINAYIKGRLISIELEQQPSEAETLIADIETWLRAPELVRARRVRGEPRTGPLQPNLASGFSRERVEGRLALALRRLVSRHMGLRLVLVRFRFLFFLISFLGLRHGDPPVCSLDPPF
jgi:hypothetical protein